MHEANLPSFSKLASMVMDELLVPEDDVNRRHLSSIQSNDNVSDISIDRLFSKLEHEYHLSDIEDVVSRLLSSSNIANTICHKIICDLATTSKGEMRVITTNFDDLFSRASEREGRVYPDFPKITIRRKLSELVYLHGKCNNSNKSDTNELVLSSRAFGKAYMSDGSASKFLKDIFNHHTVVFVGYSSEDPPVQYLLDALLQPTSSKYPVFSFQKKNGEQAEKRWTERGIIPIAYDQHDNLWETLSAWRRQVSNQEKWIDSVLTKASIGPYLLADWQRSQVAYLASSKNGASAIANRDSPIPSEWLFCFDPEFRYAASSNISSFARRTPEYLDPFDILGLTDDTPTIISSPKVLNQTPKKPANAWSAFDENSQTTKGVGVASRSARFSKNRNLSQRQVNLARWIGKIYDQPSTLLWALYGYNLSPKLKKRIEREIVSNHTKQKKKVDFQWKLIFENWKISYSDRSKCLERLESEVAKHGWNNARVQEYKLFSRPILVPYDGFRLGAIQQDDIDSKTIHDFAKLDTRFGLSSTSLLQSKNYIRSLIRADRKNLEFTIEWKKLDRTYDEWNLPNLVTLEQIDFSNSVHGEYSPVFYYLVRLIDLISSNRSLAMSEFKTWPRDDKNIFASLRIWAASRPDFLDDRNAGIVFTTLPQEVFWSGQHETDLRDALARRWNTLSRRTVRRIEDRILDGDERRENEAAEDYDERCATLSVGLWKWLSDNKCNLSDKFSQSIARIQRPFSSSFSMKSVAANLLLESMRSSNVKPTHIDVKLDDAIDFCTRGSAQDISTIEAMHRFHTLYESRGISWILSAVRRKIKNEICPTLIWAMALGYIREDGWKIRHTIFVANLIDRTSSSVFYENRFFYIRWFMETSSYFGCALLDIRNRIFYRSYEAIKSDGEYSSIAFIATSSRDEMWISGRSRALSGQLAEALLSYTEVKSTTDDFSLPGFWLDNAYHLMNLKDINGCVALFCFVRKIQWFFDHAKEWTKKHIIEKIVSTESLVKEAFWTGISYRDEGGFSFDLFQEIKVKLLEVLSDPVYLSQECQSRLASLALAGWGNRRGGRRWISSNEFSWALKNGTDAFRMRILSEIEKKLKGHEIDVQEVENFFLYVWPRTRSAKSSNHSKAMVGIVTSDSTRFLKIAPVITQRLGVVQDFGDLMRSLLESSEHILERYPETVFEIIVRIIPPDSEIADKPTFEVLTKLENASNRIRREERFRKLMDRCKVG